MEHAHRRENIHEESERLKQALDVIGADMHTIFGLLTNPASTDSGGRMSYFQVILKLLEIADHSPSLVDFYWPQVSLFSLAHTPLLPPPLTPPSPLPLFLPHVIDIVSPRTPPLC